MLELSKLAAELVGMEYKLQDFTEDVSDLYRYAEHQRDYCIFVVDNRNSDLARIRIYPSLDDAEFLVEVIARPDLAITLAIIAAESKLREMEGNDE